MLHKIHLYIHCAAVLLLVSILMLLPMNCQANKWSTTNWQVFCINPQDCEPANEVMAAQLVKGSLWLESLGFEQPKSYNNTYLDDEGDDELIFWIANISDEKVAQLGPDFYGAFEFEEDLIWLASDRYFNIGTSGQNHEHELFQYTNTNTVGSVHELFHAIQNSDTYHLSMTGNHDWIIEGSAVAVQLDYAKWIEPDTDALFTYGTYTHPIHKPTKSFDNYLTASFWLFIGTHIDSEPRIAYLDDLFRNKLLTKDRGIAGVDDFLKPHGGLFKLFPLYMTQVPFKTAFGQLKQWQLNLPSGKKEISKIFSGSVKQIAAVASTLTVTHHSEKPVEVRIEFAGDDSDLHLIVDGTLQLNQQQPARNVFVQQVNGQKENFELIMAEVAKAATESKDRDFSVKVTLKELEPLPCGFKAEVGSGVPMAGYHEGPGRMLGNLMILSDPKTGWEARVEIPAKQPGTYQTSFQATALIVDHPSCPGCAEFWQDDNAQIKITAIDNDRKTGFVEGSFSGIAAWKGGGSTGDATPFTVKVDKFRALKYSVRKTGAMQACVDYWKNR